MKKIKKMIVQMIYGTSKGVPVSELKWSTHVVEPPVKVEINQWYNEINNQVMQLKNQI